MNDIILLPIPDFIPSYKHGVKYGYRGIGGKNLKELLTNTTKGYCMYCYRRFFVDGRNYGNLEHAIEKKNSDLLIECVPNIGVSCSVCNLSLKRKKEKKRTIPSVHIAEFEEDLVCKDLCEKPCEALRQLQKVYSRQPEAEIILQPMGVYGKDAGFKLKLQYDVLKSEFQPAYNENTYSAEEMKFILSHILQFALNDPVHKTKQLINFIKDVIDNDGKLTKREYNNMVVELFVDKLEGKTRAEILKICSVIYKISVVGFNS